MDKEIIEAEGEVRERCTRQAGALASVPLAERQAGRQAGKADRQRQCQRG